MEGEIEEEKIQAGSNFVVTSDRVLVFLQRPFFGQFFQAGATRHHLVTVGTHPLPYFPWQSTILRFCRVFRLPSVSVTFRFRQSGKFKFKGTTEEAEAVSQRLLYNDVAQCV